MPLQLNNGDVWKDYNDVDLQSLYSLYKNNAETLRSSETVSLAQNSALHIVQREVATIELDSAPVTWVGSDEATTCHILIAVDSDRKIGCVAHIDEAPEDEDVDLLQQGFNGADRLDLHLVGGFLDDRNSSENLSIGILGALAQSELNWHLKTACISALNTKYAGTGEPLPALTSAGLNTKTGEIRPLKFVDLPIEESLRGLYSMFGPNELNNIYDGEKQQLVFRPFCPSISFSTDHLAHVVKHCSDDYIRQNFSTSPSAESNNFASHIRSAFSLAGKCLNGEAIFPNNTPIVYELSGGCWTKR